MLEANASDVADATGRGASDTELDRLRLTETAGRSMAAALRTIAALGDPVGQIVDGGLRPNGLRVHRVRVPLGVVGVIYENRPNVTSDCAGLSLKAGNATMLRGSSSALGSNKVIVSSLRDSLLKAALPEDGVVLVEQTDRDSAVDFMRLDGFIDCLIPRGGESLVATVRDQATVPTVIDGEGNCHVYVDRSADLDAAVAIVVNAKTSRPGVCNVGESLLVHRDVASSFLPRIAQALEDVELVGDDDTRKFIAAGIATERDYATEFLSLKMSVAVVDDLDAAIDHICVYGTGHSEAIVTRDLEAAQIFARRVDAAAVLVMPPPGSSTEGSSAWGRRSESRHKSCTPVVRWVSRPSPARST